MLIEVFPPSPRRLLSINTRFALQRDDWDDSGYHTLYHLHYQNPKMKTATYIGEVKILKSGQTTSDIQFITKTFELLGSEFCSVGTTLDYYQRLNMLPKLERDHILVALNDVVANPELISIFSKEHAWTVSLFRGNKEWKAYLADCQALAEGNFEALATLGESFSYTPAQCDSGITLDFSAPQPPRYSGPYRQTGPSGTKVLLPERMMVLIGRNGSGKSSLLANMAHVAFASPELRATYHFSKLGTFSPNSIGFMRIITISYSAFDNFTVPGTKEKMLEQLIHDIETGTGRFIYCGLRDIVAEIRGDMSPKPARSPDVPTLEATGRRASTRLKSIDVLAKEFSRLILRIREEGKVALFRAALDPLLGDPSFADLEDQLDDMLDSEAENLFLQWSTGHKIALHVVASLVTYATRRSLILYDEPETHLHPPLMAALMHAVRVVLDEVDALCIVATHSPVLLQETLARHVRIIERDGQKLSVKPPRMETFGENVGLLTYDAFGLTASTTDYHKALDLLVEGCGSLQAIDALFTPGLSSQARAYVASCLVARGDKKE